MARQTRAQRQARREAQAEGAAAPRARASRQPQVRPAQQIQKTQTGGKRELQGSGALRFARESWGELRKVDWPGQSQVIQGTVVVLVACLIVGVYLYAADQAFQHLVQDVFLR